MKIKNCDSFCKFRLLLSGDNQLNPGPTSDVCFACKRTLNRNRFLCTKCDLRANSKFNNMVFFNSDICGDCRRWENISFSIDNSIDTELTLLDNLPSISSYNEVRRVFKNKDINFGHLHAYFPEKKN